MRIPKSLSMHGGGVAFYLYNIYFFVLSHVLCMVLQVECRWCVKVLAPDKAKIELDGNQIAA